MTREKERERERETKMTREREREISKFHKIYINLFRSSLEVLNLIPKGGGELLISHKRNFIPTWKLKIQAFSQPEYKMLLDLYV